MTTARVVEAFNEVEDRSPRVLVSAKCRAVNQLTFERCEEALAHRIVEAVADRSHRRTDASFATSLAELDRGVLTALIGVMNDGRRRTLRDRHVQRCRNQ